jgi:iron complex outermembrane receptor protein
MTRPPNVAHPMGGAMEVRKTKLKLVLGAGCALAVLAAASGAYAEQRTFSLASSRATDTIPEFARQAGIQIVAPADRLRDVKTPAIQGRYDTREALAMLVAGTGLRVASDDGRTITLVAADPQGSGAAGGGAEVEGLIVTAQKREENIQDVPIAMSAFSQEDLTTRQVAGGPDLITQIPNFSFTKTNFTGYSIQIRGIGTQAISATTDPAVAVAFNNTPFVRNRFFEQEFYDLERLEVLRGPQGTLYGRNATAGVVNIISAKPKFAYEARASVDVGNYGATRIEGMVNFPLVEDAVALRVAGAWTKREGYATNQFTGADIDGRDLWSTRMSLRFAPTDSIDANLIWEHFEEDDDRLRSGKQLCKKHVVTEIGGLPVGSSGGYFGPQTYATQGCVPVSLYSQEAFQTPNGYSLPYFGPTTALGNPLAEIDPYVSAIQSRDLRVVESSVEPEYRAKTNLVELQVSVDLTDTLTLNSETAYNADELWSLQDYNRFTTSRGSFKPAESFFRPGLINENLEFCDPQLGCSDRLLLVDLSTSESTQFSQEFRLGSDFDGPFNFSLGVNLLRHDALDKYYVFINTLTLFSAFSAGISYGDDSPYVPGVSDNSACWDTQGGGSPVGDTARFFDPNRRYVFGCPYIDPNPISALNDEGRNYFLSKNPYKLISYAAFGELYYNITPDLKLTGGLRFTVDKKQAPQIPSWLLAEAAGPYPVALTVDQEWREPTGRMALDWKPVLPFTDETLIYGSYAHGYKAGGANPPPPVVAFYGDVAVQQEVIPDVFGPEFIDAFEVGAKNTLLNGALTFNLTGFYYDYEGYQVSEIRNRAAINSNYDAEIWGLEIEADWRPLENLRLGFKGGYNGTRIADGEKNVDLMDRANGGLPDENGVTWIVVRPFPTMPSNCIIPDFVAAAGGTLHVQTSYFNTSGSGICVDAYYDHLDPVTGRPYVANPYQTNPNNVSVAPLTAAYASYPGWDPTTAPNGGRGIDKQLGGNELPNAPTYTATLTADYTAPLRGDWLVNFHADYHWQSESWGRVFNSDPYDRIEAFSVVNLAAIFSNEDAGWKVMAYIKNVFDETAITGTFLNSDDTGLTTNVFLTEPRLYGLRVTKDFTGGGWLGEIGRCEDVCPLTVEIGGGVSQFSSETETYRPAWIDTYTSPTFIFPLEVQDRDLDWGDTRSVKLTYAPAGGWRVSAGHRFGKTNGHDRAAPADEVVPGRYINTGYFAFYATPTPIQGRSGVRDSEEFAVTDFMVGKDIGVGTWGEGGESVVGAGVRYADLKSTTRIEQFGVPYSRMAAAPSTAKYVNQYFHELDSERRFEGVGPTLSWQASQPLLGSEETGWVGLDWSVTGGVLFGERSVESVEDRLGRERNTPNNAFLPIITAIYDEEVPRSRSEDVTVPNLSLSLGLSYAIDRVKVSTGYSYDRFFDSIDGGVEEAQTFDRTIHGPYLKLSLGFGG